MIHGNAWAAAPIADVPFTPMRIDSGNADLTLTQVKLGLVYLGPSKRTC